jgi:hypothetical protein
MRVAWLLFLSLWSAAGAAQTMYKCIDARQRITYSSEACEKLGLKDAGPVADRTTTMPFVPAQKSASRTETARPPAARDGDGAESGDGGAQVKPVVPMPEKLSK